MDSSKKNALLILFDGVEEIEAITPIDLLRRAKINVITANLNDDSTLIKGRDEILIQADTHFKNIHTQKFDCIIIPGGPGYTLARDDKRVIKMLIEHSRDNALIAAICAAPLVLNQAGLLDGKKYTAHFTANKILPNIANESVVSDKNIITSQGAGTAIDFSLKIIELLTNKKTAESVAVDICYHA